MVRGVWAQGNTQNTLWEDARAFPYLYLPVSVSFRYTDILKMYVAQAGVWAQGGTLGFLPSNAYQERNPHSLLKDFADEVSMHAHFPAMIATLKTARLVGDARRDLEAIYGALGDKHIVVAQTEVAALVAWIACLERFSCPGRI